MRWGHFGAAGVLFRTDDGGEWVYLLQLRSAMSHEGGTWAVPGGALDEDEDAVTGAMREAAEELGPLPDARVDATYVDHVAEDWTYTTVIATVPNRFGQPANWETDEIAWITEEEIADMPLHPAFAASLPKVLDLARSHAPG